MSGDKRIFVRTVLPENPKAVLLIIHGMVEHSLRYTEFMEFLAGMGIAVYIPDYRGHGRTAVDERRAGHFNSYEDILTDLCGIEEYVRTSYPSLPLFIMGHSFGSVLARCFVSGSRGLRGLILSGNVKRPGIDEYAGLVLSSVMKHIFGSTHRSRLLWNILFKGYNKHFKEAETMFDWLSSDKNRVDNYVNDPFCGNVFTVTYMQNVLKCLFRANSRNTVMNMPAMPLLLICGMNDPVGGFGNEADMIADDYSKKMTVTKKYYENGRHEMLNETNRKDVFRDIADWILSLS